MKLILLSVIPLAALMGCSAADPVAIAPAAGPMIHQTHRHESHSEQFGFASAKIGQDRYELTFSSPGFASKDEFEGSLLYQAALLAAQHGHSWFRLLHLPGEGGPDVHPAREVPSYGATYTHWQPHWSYRTGSYWQPWNPESGAPFWAKGVDVKDLERVEVHAIIDMGQGALPSTAATAFDARRVLKDLGPQFGRSRP